MGCFFGCLFQRKIIKQGGVKATEDSQHREVNVKSEATENLEQKEVEVSIEVGTAVSNNTTTGSGGGAAWWLIRGEATGDLKQRKKNEISVGKGVADSDREDLEFDLEDLLGAPAEVLGKGTFGTTYKATFETGRAVVVKRLRDFNRSEKEFEDMVKAIENLNNHNLLPIRAYYYSEDESLLVYEYMHMGSLSALLHGDRSGDRSSLSWEARTGIALGAASAIVHIHAIDPSTCHGNIKSSNVLLTENFKVRLSEFGLANVTGSTNVLEYTNIEGYLAPDVTDSGKVSPKADVYSFGVLLLELITGKNPTESHLKDEGLDLPRWMLSAINGEWTSAVFDVEVLQYGNVEEIMLQFLDLAFSCTAQHPDNRPSMAEVTNQIKKLCSSSLQVEKDLKYKGPKAWKIYTRSNRELQHLFNSREDGNTEAKGLVFFGNTPDMFNLEDLLRASTEVLGEGTFGTTYKAILGTKKIMCEKIE